MADFVEVMGLLRSTLAAHRDELRLLDCDVPLGGDGSSVPEGTPEGVRELVAASDGLYLDHSCRLYSADELADRQWAEGLERAELPDGGVLEDASRFFYFGEARLNPLLVDRDGSVWRVPDEGYLWFTGCRVEPITGSVEEFFFEWIVGERFRDLAGLDEDGATTSHWYRVLGLAGLVS
ncbi:hypothetical protein ACFU7Y_07715 [Kitasatospora sp. NPDC057542]|uniref:hypothetical protein n=1 Tax=Streptomycetaceae TaxID=2062 RepID=UPI001CCCB4F4|nr:hypothetical protein [Streptomyces sp. LS1784]